MRTVCIVNQKGGCGKTTTAISLAGIYASQGQRILLVDMDPQSHCAAGLGIPEKRIDLDITDALAAPEGSGIDPAKLIWKPSRNLDLIPSRMKLAGLEAARGGLADRDDRQRRLSYFLGTLSANYDICLIDCSPAIGLLTYNALAASNLALIPVETSFFSLQGASKQVSTVRSVSRQLGHSIQPTLVATIHDPASGLAGDLLDELRKRFTDAVCPYPVRQDPHLKEAASVGKSIVQYAPDCPAAEDYGMVAAWVKVRLFSRNPETAAATGEETADSLPEHSGVVQVIGSVEASAIAQRLAARLSKQPGAEAHGEHAEEPAAPVGIAGQIASDLRTRAATRAEEMARLAQKLSGRGQVAPSPVATEEAPPASASTLTLAPEVKPMAGQTPIGLPMGIRETGQGMLFVQPMAMGARIAIAADFNGWSPDRHVMRENVELGVFELCIALPPGRYSYRLVVDGHWRNDPFNPGVEINPFGEPNSVLVVTGAAR